MKKTYILFVCLLASITNCPAQSWQKVGTGINALNLTGTGNAICADVHNNIYVGGWTLDDSGGQSVYKWDGTSWNELGHGPSSLAPAGGQIEAVFADATGNIYASAYDASAGGYYVAKWDGTRWSPLGTGYPVASNISSITADRHGNLYAAGGFHDALFKYYVVKWDGTNWSEVGTGSNSLGAIAPIYCIVADTFDNIYVAGAFSNNANDTSAELYVAKWNGTNWSEVGTGVALTYYHGETIYALQEDVSGNLYAAGSFTNSRHKYYVAKWDGTTWSELGNGTNALNANGMIHSMCFDKKGNMYAAGFFTDTTANLSNPTLNATTGLVTSRDTIHPYYVAKWDGTTWGNTGMAANALNANKGIFSICPDANGNIYSVGVFTDTTVVIPYESHLPHSRTEYLYPFYVAKYNAGTSAVAPLASDDNVFIYPNPTNSKLTITTHNKIDNVEIYDITARTVFSRQYNMPKVNVNVSSLPPGTYFVRVNGVLIQKFIKE
ncbi:MAG: T9SS type A sorting domain-containing protein [Bacteroidetes bacterium]|nr:T9SS type A sorting domain-containing protein [Bacteroidota bacterium]